MSASKVKKSLEQRTQERNIAMFKSLMAGAKIREVSDEYNMARHYVKQVFSDTIRALAVQAEKTTTLVFPHTDAVYRVEREPTKHSPTRWIDWTQLTVPRVRKQAEYWLQLLKAIE